jgi:thioredoxin-like negative regulator of GroEL
LECVRSWLDVVFLNSTVNVYEDPEVAARLSITSFPTLGLFENGKFKGAYQERIAKEGVVSWAKLKATKDDL